MEQKQPYSNFCIIFGTTVVFEFIFTYYLVLVTIQKRETRPPYGYEKRDIIAAFNGFTPNLASRSPLGRSRLSVLNSN
ncbi:MAG: hypothetical protein ACPGXZ_15220 [Saprospiraceae bacterium]